MDEYAIYECQDTICRFRFPTYVEAEQIRCPRCGAHTAAKQVAFATHRVPISPPTATPTAQPHIEALLDNIRSLYNVGSLFRTADGAGVKHMHLCGISATPDNPRLAKTALGAELSVPWSYANNALETAQQLKERGYQLWALEGGTHAESLFAPEMATTPADTPIVLVVGNERAGVDPDLLTLCDRVLYIPMQQAKQSLNVVVAFGVGVYHVLNNLQQVRSTSHERAMDPLHTG